MGMLSEDSHGAFATLLLFRPAVLGRPHANAIADSMLDQALAMMLAEKHPPVTAIAELLLPLVSQDDVTLPVDFLQVQWWVFAHIVL